MASARERGSQESQYHLDTLPDEDLRLHFGSDPRSKQNRTRPKCSQLALHDGRLRNR